MFGEEHLHGFELGLSEAASGALHLGTHLVEQGFRRLDLSIAPFAGIAVRFRQDPIVEVVPLPCQRHTDSGPPLPPLAHRGVGFQPTRALPPVCIQARFEFVTSNCQWADSSVIRRRTPVVRSSRSSAIATMRRYRSPRPSVETSDSFKIIQPSADTNEDLQPPGFGVHPAHFTFHTATLTPQLPSPRNDRRYRHSQRSWE